MSHQQKLLLTGSCFAENIGDYLNGHKFNSLINPSGILFNPLSISQSLNSIIENSDLLPELLVQHEDTFFSLLHHGDFRSASRQGLLEQIHSVTRQAHLFLKEADWLVMTFGSAYVYRFLQTGHIAANCHKLPQQHFKKELLKPGEIVSAFNHLIGILKKFNPGLHIIFTVSPVKYLRDGIVENNLSKSIMIHSVHEIVNSHDHCFYFPAYELVTDDLRDYRFFKEDLAHPNEVAINYVWEKFSETYFSDDTRKLNERVSEITKAAQHRPINKNSEAHSKFCSAFLEKCSVMEKEFSFLDFSEEKAAFKLG
jgi:hypothetical protein